MTGYRRLRWNIARRTKYCRPGHNVGCQDKMLWGNRILEDKAEYWRGYVMISEARIIQRHGSGRKLMYLKYWKKWEICFFFVYLTMLGMSLKWFLSRNILPIVSSGPFMVKETDSKSVERNILNIYYFMIVLTV